MTSADRLPAHQCPFRRSTEAPALAYDADNDLFIVRSYDLVRAILRDDTTFSARVLSLDSFPVSSPLDGQPLAPGRSLLGSDGSLHRGYRALLAPWLTRAAVERYAPAARSMLRQRLDALRARDTWDVVADLCAPVLARTLCELFGMETASLAHMQRWLTLAGQTNGGAMPPALLPAFQRMQAELWCAAISCRAQSRPGILQTLMQSEARGELDAAQVLDFAISLIKGAAETTSLLVTSILAKLASQEGGSFGKDQIERHIQQALSSECPVQFTVRQATRHLAFAGIVIPAGARLLLLIGAANAECSADGRPHLAFGTGPHRCPGAELAVLLAHLILEALLPVMPGYRVLTATASRPDRPVLCGFERFEVTTAP